jgi:hypothetical protein
VVRSLLGTGRRRAAAACLWLNRVDHARIGGDRALRSLQEPVGRKERMMLFRRLILVIALMIYHSEVNNALAILAPACPDRHAEGMVHGPSAADADAASAARP